MIIKSSGKKFCLFSHNNTKFTTVCNVYQTKFKISPLATIHAHLMGQIVTTTCTFYEHAARLHNFVLDSKSGTLDKRNAPDKYLAIPSNADPAQPRYLHDYLTDND